MKLPGGQHALIDRRKIVDYCLSVDHEDGQHKARLFASILGLHPISLDNWAGRNGASTCDVLYTLTRGTYESPTRSEAARSGRRN